MTTWNLLDYPNLSFSARQPQFRTVMSALNTDVMIVQELKTAAGADSFASVLKSAWPAKVWKGGASTFLSTTDDRAEGRAAFREKRPPEWTGS